MQKTGRKSYKGGQEKPKKIWYKIKQWTAVNARSYWLLKLSISFITNH